MGLSAESGTSVPDQASDGRGGPLRPWGWLLAISGALSTLASMAATPRPAWCLGVATLGLLSCTLGILHALGTFSDLARPAMAHQGHGAARALALLGLSLVGLVLSLRLAVAGTLPWPRASAALLVTMSTLAVLGAGQAVLARLRAQGPRASKARSSPLFWILCAMVVIYVPWLGSLSLIDPWESHYAEVAREMLSREDWISLWWAQDGFFWSKPPLLFWVEGLSFLALGVPFEPDRMLAGVTQGHLPAPEWAVRAAVLPFSLVAVALAYLAVRRTHGRRAAALGAIVLCTTPFWSLVARQGMTDMPYVASVTAAISLAILGLQISPDAVVRGHVLRLGPREVRLSAQHLLLGLVVVTAASQILYLVSRNLTWFLDGPSPGFSWHPDEILAGSGGNNCGLPGNPPCQALAPVIGVLQPAVAAFFWAIALGIFLVLERGERRVQRLCFLGAWYMTALATLAKGAPGLLLPVLVALTAVLATGRARDLARLELPALGLLLLCVALPWHVQAFARHGAPFTDRLIFHDMIERAFEHVHDTNAGADVSLGYYLWQLGYGLFPWTGLSAVAVLSWLRTDQQGARKEVTITLGLWVMLAFSMFTLSLTKYHHYALPVVPPLALLTGITLARPPDRRLSPFFVLMGLGAAVLSVLVGRDFLSAGPVPGQARLIDLFTYKYDRAWPASVDFSGVLAGFSLMAAVLSALLWVPRLHRALCTLLVAVACLWCAFLGNDYLVRLAPHWGQRETLLTYYRTRAGPGEPIVAYQMNWKGENFYTGNRLATFVTSGEPFERWLDQQRNQGIRRIYVMTEYDRRSYLEDELGKVRAFTTLTGRDLCNKFFLARVEL